jgi:hypothetical protein
MAGQYMNIKVYSHAATTALQTINLRRQMQDN